MFNSELSGNIAEITLNPKTKGIKKTTFHQKHLRFRCHRCAIFCCKLGGPELTQEDIERIKQSSYPVEDFLEPSLNKEFKGLRVICSRLKNRDDGSCVFLTFDAAKGVRECSIHNVRPALCRLYPFNFERAGPFCFMLKLIPCCRGLNDPHGELVDEEFVINRLVDAILDLMMKCDAY